MKRSVLSSNLSASCPLASSTRRIRSCWNGATGATSKALIKFLKKLFRPPLHQDTGKEQKNEIMEIRQQSGFFVQEVFLNRNGKTYYPPNKNHSHISPLPRQNVMLHAI